MPIGSARLAPATRLPTAAKLWVGYLRLIDIAEAAEEALASLASFAAEPQIGMRVHHIHTTGLKLSRLLARLGQLRSVTEGLGLPLDGVAEARLAVEVADLRSALQATRPPIPRAFLTHRRFAPSRTRLPPSCRRCAASGISCGPSWFRPFGFPRATTGVTCLSGRQCHCSQRSGSTTRPAGPAAHRRLAGAHVATKAALCAAAGRAFGSTEPPSELYVEYMDTLPCADVCTIDKLWRWASAGRFGFAVQLAIYRDLGGYGLLRFRYLAGFLLPHRLDRA